MKHPSHRIGIIGLGYVGLPLAVEFGKKYNVIGFDIHPQRVNELQNGFDRTNEITPENLRSSKGLTCTMELEMLRDCNIFIVTVPTPVDRYNRPDLTPLLKASESVGKVLKRGDIIVYESTVYPGSTEEDCVPILEKTSGLIYNKDFFCGYSPERINPGDKEHTVTNILKITSGSTPETAEIVNALYASIITAGTHLASSIRVAEAAKVIENAQRDINIAFVNELAKIFNHLNIDTQEVLEAAGTKWNFLKFKPGLVGGHCIGVDPYYLAQKAQEVGYHPEIILSGRRLNDEMGRYIASECIRLMIKKDIKIKGSKVLMMGITFKEDCPDIRNSRVCDIIRTLQSHDIDVDVYDPLANTAEVEHEYGLKLTPAEDICKYGYDAVILAVAHNEFLSLDIRSFCKSPAVVYDVKSILPKQLVDARL